MDSGDSGTFAMRISLNPDGTPAGFSEAPTMDLDGFLAMPAGGEGSLDINNGVLEGEQSKEELEETFHSHMQVEPFTHEEDTALSCQSANARYVTLNSWNCCYRSIQVS